MLRHVCDLSLAAGLQPAEALAAAIGVSAERVQAATAHTWFVVRPDGLIHTRQGQQRDSRRRTCGPQEED